MRFHTRPAQPEDAESLAAIGAATFALACPPSTPPAELEAYIRAELSPEKFRAHLACPQKSLVTAEMDQRVVGYLMLCREDCPSEVPALRPLELRRLYVLSQFHGTGVGQTLLGVALEQVRAASTMPCGWVCPGTMPAASRSTASSASGWSVSSVLRSAPSCTRISSCPGPSPRDVRTYSPYARCWRRHRRLLSCTHGEKSGIPCRICAQEMADGP